jgi:Domain of unknown function DUF29
MPDGPRYDDDFYAWTQYQAEVLRTMRRADNRLDRDNLAEEIEDLGKSERKAVRSQIVRIIEHLLKLEYSPALDSRSDWEASVIEARQELAIASPKPCGAMPRECCPPFMLALASLRASGCGTLGRPEPPDSCPQNALTRSTKFARTAGFRSCPIRAGARFARRPLSSSTARSISRLGRSG